MTTDPADFDRLVRYRMAYAAAQDRVEALRRSERPRTIDHAAILAAVVRELGEDAPEVREAVGDACAGRRPKW